MLKPIFALVLYLMFISLNANTIYVNNLKGNDKNDGSKPEQAVRTFNKAVSLLTPGSTLEIMKTDSPYLDNIELVDISGTPSAPISIKGNNAIISGLRPLDKAKWLLHKPGIWKYVFKKLPTHCNPFLVLQGKKVNTRSSPDKLQKLEFCWQVDSFYFMPEEGKSPQDYALSATVGYTGVRFTKSSYIHCRNLISEYHSNDGFSQGLDCFGNHFFNIEGRYNGDDGFSLHEDSEAFVQNAFFHHNFYGIQDVHCSRSYFVG